VHIATSIALAVTLLAGPARAQDPAAIDKLVQMNKKALDDYDTLEWESAKRTLLEALTAAKKAGLDNHAVMARTYVHLGAVYVTGYKDRNKAIQSFTRALEIDPSIQLSRGIATQEVNEVFAEARRQRAGGGTVPPPPPPPPPP
jgi:tetratricopeptide (TPR) repeat protein